MRSEKYKEFRENFIKKTFDLSDAKRIEYTEGNQDADVHTNFRRIGEELGLSPLKIIAVYLLKHIKSLLTFFKLGKTFSNESIESRVSDIVNYLILFLAYLHYENIKETDDRPEKRSNTK